MKIEPKFEWFMVYGKNGYGQIQTPNLAFFWSNEIKGTRTYCIGIGLIFLNIEIWINRGD
jgi:hypothetical protein